MKKGILLLLFLTVLAVLPARAGNTGDDAANAATLIRSLLAGQFETGPGNRVELEIGAVNPRLQLAQCRKLQPHLLPGTRLWGRTRIGLRCIEGPVQWNIYLPITVKVYGQALVVEQALQAGHVLEPGDLTQAEVDLAAENSPVLYDANAVEGRILLRAMKPGQALRKNNLRKQRWFAAGDAVDILARGDGFTASSRGRALTAGVEGTVVRVRTEGGRIVTGRPVGERLVEIKL